MLELSVLCCSVQGSEPKARTAAQLHWLVRPSQLEKPELQHGDPGAEAGALGSRMSTRACTLTSDTGVRFSS